MATHRTFVTILELCIRPGFDSAMGKVGMANFMKVEMVVTTRANLLLQRGNICSRGRTICSRGGPHVVEWDHM